MVDHREPEQIRHERDAEPQTGGQDLGHQDSAWRDREARQERRAPRSGVRDDGRDAEERGEQSQEHRGHELIGPPEWLQLFESIGEQKAEQGRQAVCHAFDIPVSSQPVAVPYGIYTIPEISMVGMTGQELTEKAIPYEVGCARYREIARGHIVGDTEGLLKVFFHRETLAILGVHIIGTEATELIHVGQAVQSFGGGLQYFIDAVFNYPTLAECYKVAALDGYNRIQIVRHDEEELKTLGQAAEPTPEVERSV